MNKAPPKSAVYALAVAQTLIWGSLFYSFPALLLRWESTLGWTKTDLTAAFSAANRRAGRLASPIPLRPAPSPWRRSGSFFDEIETGEYELLHAENGRQSRQGQEHDGRQKQADHQQSGDHTLLKH